MADINRVAAAFVAALRKVGVAVPVGSALRYYESLGALGISSEHDVYWAGRATLIHDPELVPVYDHVFAAFWAASMARSGSRSPVATSTMLRGW